MSNETTPSDVSSSLEFPCNGTTISLPVTDVILPNGSTRRGFQLQVGTPPQLISARPAIHFAEGINTHVKIIASTSLNFNNCMGWFEEAGAPKSSLFQRCTTFAGGVYTRSLSTTNSDPNPYEPGETDIITVGPEKLENFLFNTVYPNGQSDFNFHFIGLQRGSTMLRTLYEKKIIGTKSWSYNQGATGGYPLGMEKRADGMFTLGGFDYGQFEGKQVTQNLDTSTQAMSICPISIKVKRLVFKDAAGTVDLSNSMDSFTACIDPLSEAIQIPPIAFTRLEAHKNKKFQTKTFRNLSSIYFDTALIDSGPSFFTGDLTIVLENGFETTIPNSELVKPYTDILDTGLEVTNTSVKILTLTDYDTAQNVYPKFGVPFLAAAYIHVNYDDNMMFLAKPKHLAQSTDKYRNSYGTPIAFEERPHPQVVRPEECTPLARNSTALDHNPPSPNRLSKGAIAGLTLCGVAVVVIGWLVWYYRFYKRRKMDAAALKASQKPYGGMLLEADNREVVPSRTELQGLGKAELATSSGAVSIAELVAVAEYYELDSGDRQVGEKAAMKP